MKQIEKLPEAFNRYWKMQGVLDFAVFEDASGAEEEILSAIPQALQEQRFFDAEKLRAIGCKRIRERAFFGDWYDLEAGQLLKIGTWRTANGREFRDPRLSNLDKVEIVSGSGPCPEAGAGGQFAYAFSSPPYGLSGRPSDVQAAFVEIRDFILPPNEHCEICDWTSTRLPEASDYFERGMEWWGVFLFSLYVPELRRLTIVAGSTTD